MNNLQTAYIVTVDMGYGHQRAVYPLQDIAAAPDGWNGGSRKPIITANNYPGIPPRDRRRWEGGRSLYEQVSRLKHIPIIGSGIFAFMDYLQRIQPFYPKRDLTAPTAQLKQIFRMIHRGWGKHLINELNKNPLPLITSFFTIAYFAEEHGYSGPIYCICTDSDLSRAWAPLHATTTKIKYLAPNRRVKERLQLYGVPADNIFVTGFPLPFENIGQDMNQLRKSIGERICNLDPENRYRNKYQPTLEEHLGEQYCVASAKRPLTITFAVGGAGAQRDIGTVILRSLHEYIDRGEIQLNLVAGTRNDVYRYYADVIKKLHFKQKNHVGVHIIYDDNKLEYFLKFNTILNNTDILWTKPSELSFYAGLGLPIIIAPVVGSQEVFNQMWLQAIGAGIPQEDPRFVHEWLFDWLKSGWLAEAAMNGFLDAPRNGTTHIKDIVLEGKRSEIQDMHLL